MPSGKGAGSPGRDDLVSRDLDYIEISLDGMSTVHHDRFRGFSGAFDRTIQGISACLKAGFDTCIATTVTWDTLDQVPCNPGRTTVTSMHRIREAVRNRDIP